ncbi:hypothetical protein ACQCLI_32250 (plasmid) [Pseudomonas nitroreducens]|uniref:hypothetical protein n=1 Tax=Pseudomonas nitroreducens TaxID=46680 RepID=UPI000380EB49|nr:hypothetical protein [Pseudomonas nitroreducens]
MHQINREALTNPECLQAARRLLAGRGECDNSTPASVRAVVEAVQAGWFIIPAGRGGSYTKRQFDHFDRCFAVAPWIRQIQVEAKAFDQVLRSKLGNRYSLTFPGGMKLTAPSLKADALPYRVARLPHTFQAGKFKPDLLVSCLEDTQQSCRRIRTEISALTPDWVLCPTTSVADLYSHLGQHGQESLLLTVLLSTRPGYLPLEDQRWLKQVQSGMMPPAEYERRAAERDRAQAQASREAWQSRFARIQTLASVLDALPSYHQATITRRVKQVDRSAIPKRKGAKLVIDLGDWHEIGDRHELRNGFELVNFVLSLDMELAEAEPTWPSYHDAENTAFGKILLLRAEMTQQAPARARGDEFDDFPARYAGSNGHAA